MLVRRGQVALGKSGPFSTRHSILQVQNSQLSLLSLCLGCLVSVGGVHSSKVRVAYPLNFDTMGHLEKARGHGTYSKRYHCTPRRVLRFLESFCSA